MFVPGCHEKKLHSVMCDWNHDMFQLLRPMTFLLGRSSTYQTSEDFVGPGHVISCVCFQTIRQTKLFQKSPTLKSFDSWAINKNIIGIAVKRLPTNKIPPMILTFNLFFLCAQGWLTTQLWSCKRHSNNQHRNKHHINHPICWSVWNTTSFLF